MTSNPPKSKYVPPQKRGASSSTFFFLFVALCRCESRFRPRCRRGEVMTASGPVVDATSASHAVASLGR